jgi:hypothetical protein
MRVGTLAAFVASSIEEVLARYKNNFAFLRCLMVPKLPLLRKHFAKASLLDGLTRKLPSLLALSLLPLLPLDVALRRPMVTALGPELALLLR